jgi:hypothetical protein
MTYPPPPGPGDQGQPPPDPLYQPPIEAYQPPPPYVAPPPPAYPIYPGQPYQQGQASQAPGQPPILPYQPPDQVYPTPAYQYGYGPYGYSAYQPHRPADGLAVASLIVSCVAVPAMCLYGVPGLIGTVGAILGHVARRRITRTGAGGAGMALAGIIVGWTAAAIGAVLAVVFIVLIVNSENG